MSLLIINTLPEDDAEAVKAIEKLSEVSDNVKVVNTAEMNIMYCTGCRVCMFQNPGLCCLEDDYIEIAKLFFEYNKVVVISNTALNFLDHKTMRLFERRFPFAVVLCEYRGNSIRHVLRYDKRFKIGILYKGCLDRDLLNEWLNLYTNHADDKSLGAFQIDCVEELCKCILQ